MGHTYLLLNGRKEEGAADGELAKIGQAIDLGYLPIILRVLVYLKAHEW